MAIEAHLLRPSLAPFPATTEPSEAEIQKLAYHLWLEGGCRPGVELDNWLAAKELLRHRHGHIHGHALRGSHPGVAATRQTAAGW